jgi:hypothetical protein
MLPEPVPVPVPVPVPTLMCTYALPDVPDVRTTSTGTKKKPDVRFASESPPPQPTPLRYESQLLSIPSSAVGTRLVVSVKMYIQLN